MRFFTYIILVVSLASCGKERKPFKGESIEEGQQSDTPEVNSSSFTSYTSKQWNFAIEYPSSLKVAESELPGSSEVVNFYDSSNDTIPPFVIHEDPEASYIAFLPQGYPVDGPSGKSESLMNWKGNPPISFSYDKKESRVYLLENGDAWAFNIRFSETPPGWKRHGNIFVHYAVNNLKTLCYSGSTGEIIPMDQCNASGEDEIRISGDVSKRSKAHLNAALRRLSFHDTTGVLTPLSDMIRLQSPDSKMIISSPLLLKGEARGSWFFEGQAPFQLVDANDKVIARSSILTTGNWMTTDFVPFEGRISFELPKEKRGYLIVNRANASAKPEMDRSLLIPVVFK